jgi:hypothetical protein
LKDRFRGAATAGTGTNTPGERLLGWCAQPGVSSALDRQRCERIFSEVEKTRAKS